MAHSMPWIGDMFPIPKDPPTFIFSPSQSWYAAVRMDPVAMVKDLDDPVVLAAAQAMAPKTYLVYIIRELELAFPGKPWYLYTLSVLGTSLRAEDQEKGITPDMCIPVFPNTTHPTGREPLHPKKPFPFKNCYHWIEMEMNVRVLPQPEQFDLRLAIHLPGSEQVQMDCEWSNDEDRMQQTGPVRVDANNLQAAFPPSPSAPSEGGLSIPERELPPPQDIHADTRPAPHSPSRSLSDSCSTRSFVSDQSDLNSVDAIMQMDIFSGPDQDLAILPLLHLWENVGEHLREEDIPNPLELFRERDEIVKIIRDARVRAYAALHAQESESDNATETRGPKLAVTGSGKGRESYTEPAPHRRRIRPLKAWRKLRRSVKAFSARISSRLVLPCLPVWP